MLDEQNTVTDDNWAEMDSCHRCYNVVSVDVIDADGCNICRSKAEDIADPDRWPLTWATSLELHYHAVFGERYLDRQTHADVYDALESVRGARIEAAEALDCAVGAFGYHATPLSIEDCRWYRARTRNEMGDLDYGRYPRAEYLRDSDAARG